VQIDDDDDDLYNQFISWISAQRMTELNRALKAITKRARSYDDDYVPMTTLAMFWTTQASSATISGLAVPQYSTSQISGMITSSTMGIISGSPEKKKTTSICGNM
jgi:hypothetical protein